MQTIVLDPSCSSSKVMAKRSYTLAISAVGIIPVLCQHAASWLTRIIAEPWWVKSIVRNPAVISYTLGSKRLDKIYLDTTFACASNIYRTFCTKADGLAELLRKVESYPDDTVFYFRAWTFGYEDAWVALSKALNAKVRLPSSNLCCQ